MKKSRCNRWITCFAEGLGVRASAPAGRVVSSLSLVACVRIWGRAEESADSSASLRMNFFKQPEKAKGTAEAVPFAMYCWVV